MHGGSGVNVSVEGKGKELIGFGHFRFDLQQLRRDVFLQAPNTEECFKVMVTRTDEISYSKNAVSRFTS